MLAVTLGGRFALPRDAAMTNFYRNGVSELALRYEYNPIPRHPGRYTSPAAKLLGASVRAGTPL